MAIIIVFSLCGCIKFNKIYPNSSSEPNSSPSGWFLIGGSYQGSGLALKGNVSTYAGTAGESGNTNGPLSLSRFSGADSMAINKNIIYITEGGNSGVRKLNITTGEVTTILDHTGFSGQYFGITSYGEYIYAFDTTTYTVIKIDGRTEEISILAGNGVAGNSDGYGINASFSGGTSLTTDGKFIFLADYSNLIRKINITTGYVSTMNLSLPVSMGINNLATDGSSLYAVAEGQALLKISLDDYSYSTLIPNVAGSICFDGKYLYFQKNGSIRRMSLSSNVVENLSGDENNWGHLDGLGVNALFSNNLGAMISDGKRLYVSDINNYVIRVID